MTNPSFKMSADTRFLFQELKKLGPGDTVSYADISALLGREINGASPVLQSAKKACLRESIVIDVVRGVGLRRLRDDEIVRCIDKDLGSIRRKSRKGVRKLVSVQDFSALSPRDQLSHSVKMTVLSMTAEVSSDKSMKKLEKPVAARASELSIRETLSALLGK